MKRTNVMEAVIPIIAFLCMLLLGVCDGMAGDSNVGCHLHEREALTKFKNGLRDPNNDLSSWDHLSDCCKWRGVTCHNQTRYVIKLDLSWRVSFYDHLNRRLDPALLDLKHLQSLDLSGNDFGGVSLPSFLGSFKELKCLKLSHSYFGGEIPHQIGNLSKLEYLGLSYGLHSNQIQWLMGMTSLKILHMDSVDFSKTRTSLLHALSTLPSLSELYLINCGLPSYFDLLFLKTLFPQSPVPVNLTSLRILDLSENDLGYNIFRFLANISSIESISLASNQIHRPVPHELKQLPYLKFLDLGKSELTANCSELLEGGWRSIKNLHLNDNNITGEFPTSIGNLTSLVSADFKNNFISGKVPATIGKLCTLEELYLSRNKLEELPQYLTGAHSCDEGRSLPHLTVLELSDNNLGGTIPSWMGHLASLESLDLSRNKLHGSIPATFGKLSKLEYAYMSNNFLTGILNDTHFEELKSLKELFMSSNELVFSLKSDWIPPFQLDFLFLKSCTLGPNFPQWLKTQKSMDALDVSNTSIEGSVPSWFWNFSQLNILDISHNSIEGQLPNQLTLDAASFVNLSFNHFSGPLPSSLVNSPWLDVLDASDNQFTGPIPENCTGQLSGIILSRNRISGTIPSWFGEMAFLRFLDLSHNNLSGIIPLNIGNCTSLEVLDLGHNFLLGDIPLSFGWLTSLFSLHLNRNVLSGKLPSTLQNCSDLRFLDLGDNSLSGSIKSLISDSQMSMRVLRLASNKFTGEIPSNMSCMLFLQIFDVSNNFFSGLIPQTLGNLTAMSRITRREREGLWDISLSAAVFTPNGNYFISDFDYMDYLEKLSLPAKGLMLEYTNTLDLVKSIDLSSNNFHGEIPNELTRLIELFSLNLSNNHLTGKIPRNIGNLEMLESLDLSNNDITGEIPLSLSRLLNLGKLNLSNNNLEGEIPSGKQLQTLTDPSIYLGNRELCGFPLATKCPTNETTAVEHGSKVGEGHDKLCFYISMIFGFVAGFWGMWPSHLQEIYQNSVLSLVLLKLLKLLDSLHQASLFICLVWILYVL